MAREQQGLAGDGHTLTHKVIFALEQKKGEGVKMYIDLLCTQAERCHFKNEVHILLLPLGKG